MWHCPAQGCRHVINLLKPTDLDMKSMYSEDRQWLLSLRWHMSDQRFVVLFHDMVEAHFFYHMRESGIRMSGYGTGKVDVLGQPILQKRLVSEPGQLRSDDQADFEWIKPRNHMPAFYEFH